MIAPSPSADRARSPMAISPINSIRPPPAAGDVSMADCGGGSGSAGQQAAADAEAESVRLCLELQQQENQHQPAFGDVGGLAGIDMSGLDEETKASLELAMRLEQEERQRVQEQQAAAQRLSQEPEDAESLALAIRLQQEDDEMALRNALGVLPSNGDDDDEPGSPSQYSYEQLMQLGEAVGEVSRGAQAEDIVKLRVVTHAAATRDPCVLLGEQCAICRMEYEPSDELRVLPCGHADHCECMDQWLAVNKSCPICMKEINAPPQSPNPAQTAAAATTAGAAAAAGGAAADAAVATPVGACGCAAHSSASLPSSAQPVTSGSAPVVNAPPSASVAAPVVSPSSPVAAASTPETPVPLA